jgi:hypothetical protein
MGGHMRDHRGLTRRIGGLAGRAAQWSRRRHRVAPSRAGL